MKYDEVLLKAMRIFTPFSPCVQTDLWVLSLVHK